jgi:hypothetical protein
MRATIVGDAKAKGVGPIPIHIVRYKRRAEKREYNIAYISGRREQKA